MRILIIEDEPKIVEVISSRLKKENYVVDINKNGEEGLDATYGGYIEAENVEITTQGGSCATLATDRGEGTVTAKNSKLETNGSGSPIIYSTGNISIENTEGTTEWGTTGTNGGNLTLNAENQTLKGNIEIDNISTLKMNLTNSQYTGTINGEQTAKQIDIKIDSNTKIKLTGNSYVTSLEDEDTTYSNIDFNGYTLYVNGTAIN